MADVVATVLTKFKGDNSDLKRKIREVDTAQQKAGKSHVKSMEVQNKGLASSIAMWGKVAAGIGTVLVAVKALKQGYETLQVNQRLYAAAAGADMHGLRRATSGLVDDTRILQFAAKAMNGTFKLSQDQMERTLQGVVALRKTMGHELAPTLDRVEKAITEGNVEALKKLGLVMTGVKANSVEAMTAAVKALGGEYDKLGGDVEVAGDAMGRQGIKLANATDTLSESMGRIAVALTPVVALLADAVALIARLPEVSDGLVGVDTKGGSQIEQMKRQLATERAKLARFSSGVGQGLGKQRRITEQQSIVDSLQTHLNEREASQFRRDGGFAKLGKDMLPIFDGFGAVVGMFSDSSGGGASSGGKPSASRGSARTGTPTDLAELLAKFFSEDHRSLSQRAQGAVSSIGRIGQGFLDRNAEAGVGPAAERARAEEEARQSALEALEQANKLAADLAAKATKQQRSLMASAFGTPEEITAQAAALELFAGTFNTLTQATGSAFDAMITGSMSAGEAFKKALGEGLRAMAVEMSMKAMRHGVEALVSLVLLDFPAAAQHATAASLYAGGAIALGVGAASLGAGAPASAPASAGGVGAGAAGAGVPASSGSPGDGKSTQVMLLGGGFEGLTERQRLSLLRRSIKKAGATIEGDVVFNG